MSSEQNIIVLVHWNGVLTNVDNEVKYSSFPNAVLFLNADVSYSTLCENVLSQISRDGLNEIKTIHGKFPFDTRDGVCASMPWPIHDEPSWIYFVQIVSNVYNRLEVFIDATNRDVVIPLHEGPSRRRRNPMPSTLNQGPSMVHMDSSHEAVEDEDDPDYNNLSFSEEESASDDSDDSHDSSWAVPHNQEDPFVEPAYRVEDPIHVGRIYASFDELKKAVSIQTLKEYRAFENVSKRPTYWRAKCVHPEQCSWHIQAAQVKDTDSWKVNQYQPRHNCIPTYTRAKIDKLLTSKFIASEISSTIRIKPDYSIKLIMNDIHQKYNIRVGYKKAWYARILALEQRFGNWETSYNDLPNVLQAVAYTNPGSIIDIQSDNTNTQGTYEFKFAFWSIKAAIDGFNHCLPVVSIDGTHLYGKYKGHLLIAVAMNANREIYPLAFGVVDSENGASWKWFLQLLVTHIILTDRNVCIISDRHAAIDYAFRNVEQLGTPRIQRRYCLRHIRSNFMTQFRSKQLKKLCWQAESTPIVSEFHQYMQQIRGTNERAFKYLNDIPQEKWALCFDGGCRYGILTTNLSESFNNALKRCRTLPISALVRATFDKLVQLFAQRRTDVATSWISFSGQHSERAYGALATKTSHCGSSTQPLHRNLLGLHRKCNTCYGESIQTCL
ncbi:unnamed protein product [Cuscuta epithymum]|uniref:MULE transposase domain-containing protein n=1 Tax=Cuscuta epithymum TaxID=186058 RepID=A0AAV0DBD9_9ASTE|nr:unnamed protein product [Cuscuta epithymum]